MKKLKFYIIILFLFVSLVGCAEQKLLEDVGLATLLGYDLGSDDSMSTTLVIREVDPSFQSNIAIVTSENQTIKGTQIENNRKISKKIVPGQMRVVLYGDELAKEGIGHYIDTLSNNSAYSDNIIMAVVEGQTKSLLEYQYKNIEDVGQNIFKLLEQNIENEQVMSSTLHEVTHDYYSLGRDIAMPILKREDEYVVISGVALFKKGKMVGELPPEDSFYVKLSRDLFNSGLYETIIQGEDLPPSLMNNPPDKIPLVFDTIKSKKDLKLVNKTTPEIDLHITLEARILEINPGINLGEPKNVTKLEKAVSKSISRELSRVIAYCQKVDSDVFGLGEYYKSSVRQSKLTHEKWHEKYKDAKVNVQVEFTILRSGVFELQ
jgi:spore germination protein